MSNWVDAEELASRAMEYFESGRLEDAEEALRHAIEIDGDRPEWHHQLGVMLHIADRAKDAIACFDQASRLAPDQSEHIEASVAACGSIGDHAAAARRLDRLVKLKTEDPRLWASLIGAHAACDQHEEAETAFYLAEMSLGELHASCLTAMGTSLTRRHQWKRAIWCFREAIRVDAEWMPAHRHLAEALAAHGEIKEAMETYEHLVRDRPVESATAVAWAMLLVNQGRFRQAGEVARQVLEVEPVNADAHFVIALIARAQSRWEQAAQQCQLVRRLDRNHLHADRVLAECLVRLGQIGDARRVLSGLAKRSRDRLHTLPQEDLIALGHLLIDVGLPEDAASMYERVASGQGESDLGLMRGLAKARYMAGDLAGGRAISRRLLRKDPQCVASLSNLCRAALEQGRLTEADGWIRRARTVAPHDAGIRRLRIKLRLARVLDSVRRLFGAD